MAEYNNFVFSSHFSEQINGLIALKKGLGYQYERQSEVLKRFDRFCLERWSHQKTLSKELVSDWLSACAGRSPKTLRHMLTPVSHLGAYICNMGSEAYAFPTITLPREHRYTPHIYSSDELQRFFDETDRCCYSVEAPLRHLMMPVLFRLLYCCGLRISEVLSLKVRDVDVENGVLTVTDSKNGGERYVPMSEEMTRRCREYHRAVHDSKEKHTYFFPSPTGEKLVYINIYSNFRRFLRNAGITHGGRKNAIRIHDFRHTFAVHCLKRWVKEEKDLNVYYPYLRVYMGHTLFRYTAYYLRLTADLYPDITEKLEKSLAGVIPSIGGDECEDE